MSADGGETWRELKLNLPTVAVHDLVVKDNDLVVGTCGRSIWIFDELTPIRELTAKASAEAVHLFPPAPFEPVYEHAREMGLRLTIHAGEAVGPESVWGALGLGVERIGHGVRSIEDELLMFPIR